MHERARKRLVAELAEGGRRAAKSLDCERCGAPVLQGDDHDDVAYVATVDAEALDPVDEMLAIFDGRATYDLTKQSGKEARAGARALYYREPWHVHSDKAPPGTVHAAHRCDPNDIERRRLDDAPVSGLW